MTWKRSNSLARQTSRTPQEPPSELRSDRNLSPTDVVAESFFLSLSQTWFPILRMNLTVAFLLWLKIEEVTKNMVTHSIHLQICKSCSDFLIISWKQICKFPWKKCFIWSQANFQLIFIYCQNYSPCWFVFLPVGTSYIFCMFSWPAVH